MLSRMLILLLLLPAAARAIDIAGVLQLAEQHDASWQAAQAQYLADVENQSQSDAALLPQVNFSAFSSKTSASTRNSTSTVSPNGDTRFDASGYSLDLSQTLYNQALFDAAEADSLRSAAALATLEAARQDLYLRVATAYFDLLGKQDALAFARAEQNAIANQLEQYRERFKAGLVSITDVKDSQAQYDLAAANTIIAENDLNNSRESLRLIINQPISQLAGLRDELPLQTPEPDDIDAWQQTALDNNLLLRAKRYLLQAANRDLAASQAGHYPTLSLNARHSFTSSGGSTVSNAFSGRDISENRLTLNLDIPVYSGGATSAAARQKRALRDAAQAQLTQQQRLTIQQVRSAFLNIKASISQVKALKQAVASTRSATEAAQLGFESGTRNSVDVLLAQREQFASENRYAKARYDYLLNVLKLKRAAGALSAQDLQTTNRFIAD